MEEIKNMQKKALKIYSSYNDEEILELVAIYLPAYIQMTKSEEIAADILREYGIEYKSINTEFKKEYYEIMLCAQSRGIKIPDDIYDAEIDADDIVDRIEEKRYEEISNIQNKFYGLDCEESYQDGELDSFFGEETFESTIMQINDLYDRIIDRVYKTYLNKKKAKRR